MRRLAVLGLLAFAVSAEDGLPQLRARMRHAKDRVFPALVHIVNVDEVFTQGRRDRVVSTGSGFFIDADGHIVTNFHVAGQADRLFVTLASKQQVKAELIAGDPYTDLALLRVDPKAAFPDGKPVFAVFGRSGDLDEGDFVMAMGSPLSLARSVSFGIVSCRERVLEDMQLAGQQTGRYNTWLQTDAAINPGNSGGPLVNLDGEVVGVNTRANLAANNIGFAIPSDVVREVVKALKEFKAVPRSDLGVTLQPLDQIADTAFAADAEGVLVAAVDSGSPAERAGMRPGDFILQLNGEPFGARFGEELPRLYRRIAALPAGKPATLVVRRGEQAGEVRLEPVPLGTGLGRESVIPLWGITVRSITERMARELRLDGTAGVIVSGIRPGSAASGSLEAGDVIVAVQHKEVADLTAFMALVRESVDRKDTLVRLDLRRGGVRDVTVVRPRYAGEED